MFFIIVRAVDVSRGFSAHHQELIKLCVQPWVLSCFPAVYRWCGWPECQSKHVGENKTHHKNRSAFVGHLCIFIYVVFEMANIQSNMNKKNFASKQAMRLHYSRKRFR
jgi:hypothetical protein